MWEPSKVHKNMKELFSEMECLLGGSAFGASPIVVPACRKCLADQGSEMTDEWFNNKLAPPRVMIEHAIGTRNKGRFPCIRNTRVRVGHVRNPPHMIRCAKATAILHNLLVKVHKVPDAWEENSNSSSSSESIFHPSFS